MYDLHEIMACATDSTDFTVALKMVARLVGIVSPTHKAQERKARFCAVSFFFWGGGGGGGGWVATLFYLGGGGGGGEDDVHVQPFVVCYMPENSAWAQDSYSSRMTCFVIASFLPWLSKTKLTLNQVPDFTASFCWMLPVCLVRIIAQRFFLCSLRGEGCGGGLRTIIVLAKEGLLTQSLPEQAACAQDSFLVFLAFQQNIAEHLREIACSFRRCVSLNLKTRKQPS